MDAGEAEGGGETGGARAEDYSVVYLRWKGSAEGMAE